MQRQGLLLRATLYGDEIVVLDEARGNAVDLTTDVCGARQR